MRVVAFVFDGHGVNDANDIKRIAEIFTTFTPQIALRGTEVIYLEIAQCRRLYSEADLLSEAATIFEQLRLQPRVGVHASPPLAYCQAVYGTAELHRLPLSALVHFFEPFGRALLDMAAVKKMLGYLQTLGLRTLQEVLDLNPAAITSRFQIPGALLHERLLHSDQHVWARFVLEEEISESMDLETEIRLETTEPILFMMRQMLQRLLLRLTARGKSLKSLVIHLVQDRSSVVKDPYYTVTIQLTLAQPSLKTLFSIIKDRLEASLQKNPLVGYVNGLQLHVIETTPYFTVQRNLYQPKREEQQEAYTELINRLHIKLGAQNAFRASLNASYIPENNWSRTPAAGLQNREATLLPPRPLRLLNPPRRLRVLEKRLLVEGELIDCTAVHDPEIIFSEWWDQPQERIYYRLDSPQGRSYWIYRANDGFFLHGVFD